MYNTIVYLHVVYLTAFLSMSGSQEDKELFLVVSSKSCTGSSGMSSTEAVSIR